jgi:hypothetical protein
LKALLIAILFLLFPFFIFGQKSLSDDRIKSTVDTFPLLDTIIILPNLQPSKNNLTKQIAKAILFKYCKAKSICDASNPKEMPKATESVDYDTLYFVNLNNDSFPDAIILYWITPVGASGHCYQPTEAMIVSESNGYKLENEGFLPDDFRIDSVASDKNRVFVYGDEYDCSDNKMIKKFRASITALK